jgi:formiminoglutamase
MNALPNDTLWPRAGHWLSVNKPSKNPDLTYLGVPAFKTSLSHTNAHATPSAVREALLRYSTYSWTHDIDLRRLDFFDAGDVVDPDFFEGEERVAERVRQLPESELLVAVGGDNSITYSVAKAFLGDQIGRAGLITFDAHHDIREGESNGSPVRRLVAAGLQSTHVVQIGISDFANSAEYAKRAREYGITVITRAALRTRALSDVIAEALEIAGASGGPIHLDVDADVCDRSVVPACPAAAPGGISADELRQLIHLACTSSQVKSIDFTEIDATIDSPDQRTVRLAALCILEAATAVAIRTGNIED